MAGGETPLRLGTRGSALAQVQAQEVASALGGATIVPIRTAGDEAAIRWLQDRVSPDPNAPGGDKSRFVGEIERALLKDEIDIAVHSAKDLPTELPEGLELTGVPPRRQAADVWVGEDRSLDEVPTGSRVGTASLRRRAQLLAVRPDLEIREVRGNITTRVGGIRRGESEHRGLILAEAGMSRLDFDSLIGFRFDEQVMTPAQGQGSLALETRIGDERAKAAATKITDHLSRTELAAERAAVSELGASCHTPVGVRARMKEQTLRLSGFCGLPDGSEWIRDSSEGDTSDPEAVGRKLADRMKGAGAEDLLERAAEMAEAMGAAG